MDSSAEACIRFTVASSSRSSLCAFKDEMFSAPFLMKYHSLVFLHSTNYDQTFGQTTTPFTYSFTIPGWNRIACWVLRSLQMRKKKVQHDIRVLIFQEP